MSKVVKKVGNVIGDVVDFVGDTVESAFDGDIGSIIMVGASIYTGGAMMGAWGSTVPAGLGATSTAGAGATSQGAMLAAQTAEFGAAGSHLTAGALAGNTAAGAAAANAGIMGSYAAQAGAMGQTAAMEAAAKDAIGFNGTNGATYDPLKNLTPDELSATNTATDTANKSFIDKAGDALSDGYDWVKDAMGITEKAAEAGVNPAQAKGWWASLDPLTKSAIISTGGSMIAGMGASKQADEEAKRKQAEITGQRNRAGAYVPMSSIYNGTRTGLLQGAMK